VKYPLYKCVAEEIVGGTFKLVTTTKSAIFRVGSNGLMKQWIQAIEHHRIFIENIIGVSNSHRSLQRDRTYNRQVSADTMDIRSNIDHNKR
jgi:hypothetical protein